MSEYTGDLAHVAQLLEKHEGRSGESATPPALQGGQEVSWPDVIRFVETLVKIVEDRGDRLERRIRKCLALARLCRAARFNEIGGGRLVEFLHVVRAALEDDVPRNIADLLPPSRLGRVLFRTLLAVYARKDRGPLQGPAVRSRWGRFRSGWRFVRGRRRVPRVNALLPEITFEEVESHPAMPAEIDALLERYYTIKLNSLQFCGPPNFGLPFWSGVESLAFTLPAILWLAKAFANLPPFEAVQKAILLVDDHFGGNPILGSRHNRFFVRTLAQRGDLDRLIAWYSG